MSVAIFVFFDVSHSMYEGIVSTMDFIASSLESLDEKWRRLGVRIYGWLYVIRFPPYEAPVLVYDASDPASVRWSEVAEHLRRVASIRGRGMAWSNPLLGVLRGLQRHGDILKYANRAVVIVVSDFQVNLRPERTNEYIEELKDYLSGFRELDRVDYWLLVVDDPNEAGKRLISSWTSKLGAVEYRLSPGSIDNKILEIVRGI